MLRAGGNAARRGGGGGVRARGRRAAVLRDRRRRVRARVRREGAEDPRLDFREVAPGRGAPDMFAGPARRGGAAPVARRRPRGRGPRRGEGVRGARAPLRDAAARGAGRAGGAPRRARVPASAPATPTRRARRLACLAAPRRGARVPRARGPDGKPRAAGPAMRLVRRSSRRTLRASGRIRRRSTAGPLAAGSRAATPDGGVLAAAISPVPGAGARAARGQLPRPADRLDAAAVRRAARS